MCYCVQAAIASERINQIAKGSKCCNTVIGVEQELVSQLVLKRCSWNIHRAIAMQSAERRPRMFLPSQCA